MLIRVDSLESLLDGPRSRGTFVLRVVMKPPWSVQVDDGSALSLVAVVRGRTVIRTTGDTIETMTEGDLALLTKEGASVFADDVSTAPGVFIGAGQECRDPDGLLVDQSMALGVRTWGNAVDVDQAETVLLIATWHDAAEISARLLSALPDIFIRRSAEGTIAALDLLLDESIVDRPGQTAVLDRLTDLLLVALVRDWAETHNAAPHGLAHVDPVVGHALRLVHAAPAHPWTVAALAGEARVSRAVLARRFAELVGEGPISYLTRWRLAQAADLLLASDDGIESVAHRVGYGSAFALSAAFKRHYGVSPSQYRRRSA